MSLAFYYFFRFISLFIWSSYFVRQFRFSKARSCVKKAPSHFRLREKSIYLFTVYSRQKFSSSQLRWDNGTKRCKRTNSNPSKRFVIQWTVLNFYYNQLDYHPTRTRGLAFLPQPDTRNLFTANIFKKDSIQSFFYSKTVQHLSQNWRKMKWKTLFENWSNENDYFKKKKQRSFHNFLKL